MLVSVLNAKNRVQIASRNAEYRGFWWSRFHGQATGASSQGYERSERAYRLIATGGPIRFELSASQHSPIHNPAFMIRDWGSPVPAASMRIEGVRVEPGPDFRQGVVIDTNGRYTLVIWLDFKAASPRRFEIE